MRRKVLRGQTVKHTDSSPAERAGTQLCRPTSLWHRHHTSIMKGNILENVDCVKLERLFSFHRSAVNLFRLLPGKFRLNIYFTAV